MYRVKYNKLMHILKPKIKNQELSLLFSQAKDIHQFIGMLGETSVEIESALKETELNYVLIRYEGFTIQMLTRDKTFSIDVEDLLFSEGNTAGLKFAASLLDNLQQYDLIIEFI